MKKFSRSLKISGIITLFFFTWSYLPLFQFVAYAATQDKQATTAQHQKAASQKPAEKLEKLLDDLRESTSKAEEKAARGADTFSEVETIKARKADIDAIDTDLKKDFSATEQKLKTANLSKEILDRHYKFVRNYENNLAELKTNLDSIEKAKTPSALTSEIVKTQTHLATIKPPKKRKPFDPNKLPNRIVKAKERQPRLKKEEWEKGLKKESKKSKAAQRHQQKQILVAANGPLTGLLSDGIESENNLQLANQTIDSIFLNAAIDYYSNPAPEDMQETPETHITAAIRAKAAELQNRPVTIFSWLTNNIEYVPSYGSIQGADMCLQSKQCNDVDIASLAIALFRAAGFPARYEFATVEQPIEKFMNSVGGFTDPNAAITFVATGGVPIRPVITGGKITAVQFEHVYASAWIPYGNYRGTMTDNSYPIWLPLDFAVKYYTYTPGIDLKTAVPFDAQSFANQIQSTATINQTDGSVTNVNSALIQQTMPDYQTQVQNYITQNYPNATVGDVVGKKEIIQQKFHFLPATPMLKPVAYGGQSHTLPDSMLYKVSFEIQNADTMETSLSYTANIAEIAGKRVTLSYAPATSNDEQVINNYGGIFNVPAYLVSVKPQIKIEGIVAATGSAIGLGKDQTFNMQFVSPAYGTESVANIVSAGAFYAVGINSSRVSQALLAQRKAKLEAVKDTCTNNPSSDDCGGEILFTTAMTYFYLLSGFEDVTAQTNAVIKMKDVSEAIVSDGIDVTNLFGIPRSVAEAGMMIDVDRNIYVALSKDGDQTKIRPFMMSAGQMSSAMEHGIFEVMHQAKGISTIQVLQLANSQGIPIYTITQNNISAVLPVLQISSEVINDIQNAVNAGKTVVVPKQNITYYTWVGTGYIVMDPQTGAGAYMISTSLSGGGCCIAAGGVANHCLIEAVDVWHYIDTFAAIVALPTIGAAALYYAIATYGAAGVITGLAMALGLSLFAILIGAIIALVVISIIHLFIVLNTTAAAGTKRNGFYTENKRRLQWKS